MKTQLHTLPPEQAALLIRKKRFWKRTMWNSLGITVLILILGQVGTVLSMIRAFSTLQKQGAADPAALAKDISVSLYASLISLPFAALGLLIFLTAIIRCLSLPKLPK